MSEAKPSVAVVGATGAVGLEALAILAEWGWPASRVGALASARSAGARVPFGTGALPVREMNARACAGYDIALFCAGGATAKRYARGVAASGALVVDNSAAFRLDPKVPLVVPEVNGHVVRASGSRLFANPNCSTVMLVTALEPIREAFGVRLVSAATYQAVSGAGIAAIEELRAQTRAAMDGTARRARLFPSPCAFNVFPHESPVDLATGLCGEERKMVAETRRLWDAPDLSILPTCVRVPVVRAHSQALLVELERPARIDEVERAFDRAHGVRFFPRVHGEQPTPLLASGRDEVLVGRARLDETGRRLSLWACCDQLRKGAALNALQIALGRMRAGPRMAARRGAVMRVPRVPAIAHRAS